MIESGSTNPLHAPSNCEEVLYLIPGALEHSLNGAVYHLGPGDAKSVGTEPAAMVVCSARILRPHR